MFVAAAAPVSAQDPSDPPPCPPGDPECNPEEPPPPCPPNNPGCDPGNEPPPPPPPGDGGGKGGNNHHNDRGNNNGFTLVNQESSGGDIDFSGDIEVEDFSFFSFFFSFADDLCSPLNPDEINELVPGCIFA
jgi:hypothetical protein